jgi:hypothetical protein
MKQSTDILDYTKIAAGDTFTVIKCRTETLFRESVDHALAPLQQPLLASLIGVAPNLPHLPLLGERHVQRLSIRFLLAALTYLPTIPRAVLSTANVEILPPNMASRTPTPDSMGPRDRLPNLFEVLSRRTTAPVDLFSFYIYMRDVQRSVDYLDFW